MLLTKHFVPVLLLRGSRKLDLVGDREAGRERIQRLSVAANRLGCNAVAITPKVSSDEQSVDTVVSELRDAMADC